MNRVSVPFRGLLIPNTTRRTPVKSTPPGGVCGGKLFSSFHIFFSCLIQPKFPAKSGSGAKSPAFCNFCMAQAHLIPFSLIISYFTDMRGNSQFSV